MWLKIFLSIWLICLFSLKSKGQILTYQFIDPCTKQITFFSVPATGTTIFFLGQSRQFTSNDVINGTFGTWINQVYADYRKVTPCSQQSGQVTQNQIISQAISGTVQSVVGSIMSQAQSASSSTMSSMGGGTDAASKGSNTSSDNKPKNENKNANNTVRNNTSIPSNTQNNTSSNSGNNNNNNSSSSNNNSGSNDNNSTTSKSNTQTSKKEEEVAAAIIMNNDTRQEKEEESSSSSDNKNNKRGKSSNSRSNPIIVQSDLTTAQNLDRSFTPILNLGLSRSSMTGASSWGITSMTWLNFKQFALSGRYTKIHFSKSGTLKFIHNFNLTGVYTYGNVLAFMGYSGILNAGKWGVTGFNVSAAGTLIAEEDNTYLSPSFTAFYTKPFKVNNRLTVSPEIYIISTPLIYSSKEQITTTDRTFSGFLGSGFDYQITKRFKFNINYKANLSTNSEFPILSFLLIGSKINL